MHSTFTALLLIPLATAMATDWPQFRGPLGTGHAPGSAPPLEWSETKNVRWKTPIPHKGWSTPVVHGEVIWMTTATEDGKEYFALRLNRETGAVQHTIRLFTSASPEPLGNSVNGYASPSPLIDGGLVFVHFGSYGTAALDALTGEEKWRRTDLPCRHYRGPGSSLAHFKDTLIVTMDGVDVQYLIALDKKSGKTVWKTDRTTDFKDLNADGTLIDEGDLRKAYTTPLIVTPQSGSPWLISTGAKATYAYDAATGQERWNVIYDGFSNASSPVYSHGLAIINTGYGKANLHAYRVNDATRGRLPVEDVAWDCLKRVPQRSTPVVVGDHLFMFDDGGFASCLEIKSGEVKWSERLDGNFSGSPVVLGDGTLVACTEQGASYVLSPAADQMTVRHTNSLDDGMLACPVAVANALYLRTKSHLYRIEAR
ncbi:MAG: PQQ-binding-like beta-propeller repeat protein [Verrucomicrobiales bacterium]